MTGGENGRRMRDHQPIEDNTMKPSKRNLAALASLRAKLAAGPPKVSKYSAKLGRA